MEEVVSSITVIPAHAISTEPRQSTTGSVVRTVINTTRADNTTGWSNLGWEEHDLTHAAEWYCKDEKRWRALLGKDESGGVSHRVMEWFVVNYSKAKDVKYDWNGREFNVTESYRNHMLSLLKVRFDPFCRTGIGKGKTALVLLNVVDSNGQHIEIRTNLRQMNFYKWAITYNVLDYVKAHKDVISKDMSVTLSTKKRQSVTLPNGTVKLKRRRLKDPIHVVQHVKKRQKIKIC